MLACFAPGAARAIVNPQPLPAQTVTGLPASAVNGTDGGTVNNTDGGTVAGGPGLCVAYAQNTGLLGFTSDTITDLNAVFDSPLRLVPGKTLTSPLGQADALLGPVAADFAAEGHGGCGQADCLFSAASGLPAGGLIARYRGYLDIPASWVTHPVHVGFSGNPNLAVQVFDKAETSYKLIDLPDVQTAYQWRTTNAVTFPEAGLYPIEIDYYSLDTGGVLEGGVLAPGQPFKFSADIQETTDQNTPADNLYLAGFSLLLPAQFFQSTVSATVGAAGTCNQCPRQFAGQQGTGPQVGCPTGQLCNAAALCEAPSSSGSDGGKTTGPGGGPSGGIVGSSSGCAVARGGLERGQNQPARHLGWLLVCAALVVARRRRHEAQSDGDPTSSTT